MRARWQQGHRNGEDTLCRNGHSEWFASSSGHRADTLGWADIYSAVCKLSDSGWHERCKKGKALHGSSSETFCCRWAATAMFRVFQFVPCFGCSVFADDCVGGFCISAARQDWQLGNCRNWSKPNLDKVIFTLQYQMKTRLETVLLNELTLLLCEYAFHPRDHLSFACLHA